MKIISNKVVPVPISDVWRVVSDPEQMPVWNPKCVLVTAVGGTPETRKFEALFKMGSKETPASGEVVHWRISQEIAYRYTYDVGMAGSVEETFRLEQSAPTETRFIHEVDFSRSGLPWWVLVIIGFIGRFGKLKGEDPLDGIERKIRNS